MTSKRDTDATIACRAGKRMRSLRQAVTASSSDNRASVLHRAARREGNSNATIAGAGADFAAVAARTPHDGP